jgi:hypothetical protein
VAEFSSARIARSAGLEREDATEEEQHHQRNENHDDQRGAIEPLVVAYRLDKVHAGAYQRQRSEQHVVKQRRTAGDSRSLRFHGAPPRTLYWVVDRFPSGQDIARMRPAAAGRRLLAARPQQENLAASSLLVGLAALVAPLCYCSSRPSLPRNLLRTAQPLPGGTHNQMQMRRFVDGLGGCGHGQGSKRLSRHEATVYSQYGEDGVIVESSAHRNHQPALREFGSGDGRENKQRCSVMGGWLGTLDGRPRAVRGQSETGLQRTGRQGPPQRTNCFRQCGEHRGSSKRAVPESFDLLSIDIDRNDYWVWNAIQSYRPRVW